MGIYNHQKGKELISLVLAGTGTKGLVRPELPFTGSYSTVK
jgi:hypothetical protein